jgi:hypothetical protein
MSAPVAASDPAREVLDAFAEPHRRDSHVVAQQGRGTSRDRPASIHGA